MSVQPMQPYQPAPPQYGQPVYPPYQGPPPTANNVVVITRPGAGMTAAPGSCRHCGIGFPKTEYTIAGLLFALIFFPIGILCCLMMTERRCSHCHACL